MSSTETNITFLTTTKVPFRSGRVDLRGFFPRLPEKQIIVDPKLLEFVKTIKQYDLQRPLRCEIDSSPNGGILSVLLNITDKTSLDVHQLCGILVHLGTDGWPLLAISSKEEEINILVGYLLVKRKFYAVLVEHEFNNGVEEINLHVRTPKHNEDDPVLVLKII